MSAPRLTTTATARGLGTFIDASPSPFHVCATVAAELEEAGFRRLFEEREWSLDARRFYFIRGGSIIAWDLGDGNAFRIVGGHTDSPYLRLKQRPDRVSAGIRTIAL